MSSANETERSRRPWRRSRKEEAGLPYRVERQLVLNVPPLEVWPFLISPEPIWQWFADCAHLAPGDPITFDFGDGEQGYVWPSARRAVYSRGACHLRGPRQGVGVRPFSCHDLRTTGAPWLRDAGVDELVIALLLGHRSTFD